MEAGKHFLYKASKNYMVPKINIAWRKCILFVENYEILLIDIVFFFGGEYNIISNKLLLN